MLYNVIIGNTRAIDPSPEKHNWEFHRDAPRGKNHEGRSYYGNEAIKQRLYLSVNVNDKEKDKYLLPDEQMTPKVAWKTNHIQCYDLPFQGKWKNNTLNMNTSLRIMPDTDGKIMTGENEIIIYVTVANNYRIAKFYTDYEILQTYHEDDKYQGCVLVINKHELEQRVNPRTHTANALVIYAYDVKKEDTVCIKVFFTEPHEEKEDVSEKKETKKKKGKKPTPKKESNSRPLEYRLNTKVQPISNLDEKFKTFTEDVTKKYKTYMGFKCRFHPGNYPTSNFICFNDHAEQAQNLIEKVPYANAYLHVTDNNTEAIESCLSYLAKIHCRAVTLIDAKIPLELLRKYRFLYVFTISTKSDRIHCIKSS